MNKLTITLTFSLSLLVSSAKTLAMENQDQDNPLSHSLIQQAIESCHEDKNQDVLPQGFSRYFTFYSVDPIDKMIEKNTITSADKNHEYFWGYIEFAALEYAKKAPERLLSLQSLLLNADFCITDKKGILKNIHQTLTDINNNEKKDLIEKLISITTLHKETAAKESQRSDAKRESIQDQLNALTTQIGILKTQLNKEKDTKEKNLQLLEKHRILEIQDKLDTIMRRKKIKAQEIYPILKEKHNDQENEFFCSSDDEKTEYTKSELLKPLMHDPLYAQIAQDAFIEISNS